MRLKHKYKSKDIVLLKGNLPVVIEKRLGYEMCTKTYEDIPKYSVIVGGKYRTQTNQFDIECKLVRETNELR